MKLKGIGASKGISIAKVFELKTSKIEINENKIQDINAEITKVKEAIKNTILEIENIKEKASKNLGSEEAAVFDAHIQVANDPSLINGIEELIQKESVNSLFATKKITDDFSAMFENMEDAYMKERAADVKDVSKRILNSLSGNKSTDVSTINEEVIIVADDLTPSETALLDKKYVKGFLTNVGGRTSHAAIMARSLEIPAILGLKTITDKVKTNDVVAMDGNSGDVLINPSEKEIADFENKEKLLKEQDKLNQGFKGKKTLTKDGHEVELASNIGSVKDVDGALLNDAEGIGLFRSEFLYMDAKDWPAEDEQYNAYKEVLSKMGNKRVIIRTLDIGGDKKLEYYKFPEELNPFLGYRAVRFCLDNKEIFRTQLRALLRASSHGKLAIMFPMIATINEFIESKKLVDEYKKELIKEGQVVSNDIEIGMMVEIPATAVLAKQFAKHADFFSIGTNDLMQYTLAADRMSEKVSYLYQPLNPSILNMINMTIEGAHSEGKWVGMCGEMASNPNAIPLLIGMGLDEFSMSATAILGARRQISEINKEDAKSLANKALKLDTQEEVEKIVKNFNN